MGSFFTISSLFIISLLGLTYSSDFDTAIGNLKIPFLIFPLIIFSIDELTKKTTQKLLDLFSIATILAALLGLGKAFWLSYNDLGDYFYYLDFSKVLDKHTTYFSLFVCISIINIAFGLSLKSGYFKWCRVIAIAFLLFVLYLLSSKISLIYLIIATILSTIRAFLKKDSESFKIKVLRLLVLVILPIMFLTPNLKARISKEKASNISERVQLWGAVLDNYLEKNIIFGAGTGDGHLGLVERYKEIHYEVAAKDEYNAHNQYLEQLLFYGVIGLIFLIVLLFHTLRILYTKDQPLYLVIFISFLIYMCSESILERHSGLIAFSFLTTIFLSTSNQKNADAEN